MPLVSLTIVNSSECQLTLTASVLKLTCLVSKYPLFAAVVMYLTKEQHTNRVDNQWRNIPDSEWARFLISRLDFASLRPTIETGFCDACSSIDFLADSIDLGRTSNEFKGGSVDCAMCSFLYGCFSTYSTEVLDDRPRFISRSANTHSRISFYVDPGMKLSPLKDVF